MGDAQAAAVATGDLEEMKQNLERRMACMTHASSMGEKLAFMNATRIMFNLTSDGISPLMAVCEVRSPHL
jgi:hypothetical protein